MPGRPASAAPPARGRGGYTQPEQPEGQRLLLDDRELLQQLFARFGNILFVGTDEPKGAALPEKWRAPHPNMEVAAWTWKWEEGLEPQGVGTGRKDGG